MIPIWKKIFCLINYHVKPQLAHWGQSVPKSTCPTAQPTDPTSGWYSNYIEQPMLQLPEETADVLKGQYVHMSGYDDLFFMLAQPTTAT